MTDALAVTLSLVLLLGPWCILRACDLGPELHRAATEATPTPESTP